MERSAKIIHIVLIAFAFVAAQVFLILCLTCLKEDWGRAALISALVGGTALNLALITVDLIFFFRQKQLVYKICIITYVLFVFSAVICFVLLKTGFFEIFTSEESLENYLERAGVFMSVLFVVLQFLQVVILPIPSTVTVVAGSALFGPLRGSLLSLLGIVIGSLCAFLIGRYAGYRVVAWIVGKDTLDKWLKKVKGKDKLLLSAMFLLPVFPDDVLCFVAGLSSMSVWLFLGVIAVSRVLAIFTTSYSITLIPFNTWWGILVWAVIFALIAVLFVVLYKKTDAILGWFDKKFHRETRVEDKKSPSEFTLEVVGPDGAIVKKGVDKSGFSDGRRKEDGIPKQDRKQERK